MHVKQELRRTPTQRCRAISVVTIFASLSVLLQPCVYAYTLKQTFPRLGLYRIVKQNNYKDASYQAKIARHDLVIFNFYPGYNGISTVVQAVKSKNPGIPVLNYVIHNEINTSFKSYTAYANALDSNKWWLYASGGGGTKVLSVFGQLKGYNFYMTNYTDFAPKSASGDRYNTWVAKRINSDNYVVAPGLDGVFIDIMRLAPRVNGDWNRDGKTDSKDSPTVQTWHRQGMKVVNDKLRALASSKLLTGNISNWGKAKGSVPEYDGQLDGGLLESYIGEPGSPEGKDMYGNLNKWGSWSLMMEWYRNAMGRINSKKLVLLQMSGKPTDYKGFRYGFASTLMNNAYFDFSDGVNANIYWFDEFDLAGTSNTSWLGKAIDPPQTAPWQSGVYRRRFENGMVMVNPRGNGNRTVSIGSGYTRFKGKQDPTHNNGQPAVSLTILDRDAIFLRKQ